MNSHFEEEACLYILDQLGPERREAFEARLTRDPELADLVRQLEAAMERRVRALPQHEPPAGLLARIESSIEERPSGNARRPSSAFEVFARWGLAAAIALSLVTLAVQSLHRTPSVPPAVFLVSLDARRSSLAEVPFDARTGNPDERFAQLASLAQRMWAEPGRGGRKPEPNAADHAYALFDPSSSQGFISVLSLPRAEPGQSYHLWILDTSSGAVREAGVIPGTASGPGLYFFSASPEKDGAASLKPTIFMTLEDSGDAQLQRPRGRVVLGNSGF
jgi:anti-sigma-K factor RskA